MTKHQDRIDLHPDFEPEPEFYDLDDGDGDPEAAPEALPEDTEGPES